QRRGAHLPPALRGGLVDGDPVDRRGAGRGAAPLRTDLQGEVCGFHHAVRPEADAGPSLPVDRRALPRGPAHRRGHASAHAAGHRRLWQAAAAAERRAAAAGGAVEVRLQVDQVHRGHPLHRAHAEDGMERPAAIRVRLLLQRQSGRGPPALEPEERAPHRRNQKQAVCGSHPDPAVQWLRRPGRPALRRHGPAQVVLSARPARPAAPRRAGSGMVAAKALVHVLALAPAAWLGWRIAEVWRSGSDALGADPVAAIEHETGLWALRLLLVTLAITPLRRITGQASLLQFRRMLGLYTFFYACLHLAAYVVLDLGGYWAQLFEDIAKRPFITVGFLAWLLLVPLAVTSTRGWMRRLGRRWGQLHRAVYAIG